MSRRPIEFVGHPHVFPGGVFRAFCHHVVDGDTFDVLVDLGFLHYAYVTLRLRDVDTPEIFRPKDEAERAAGYEAKELVQDCILGRHVLVETEKDATTFGRFVASVRFLDADSGEWVDLGERLTAAGFSW